MAMTLAQFLEDEGYVLDKSLGGYVPTGTPSNNAANIKIGGPNISDSDINPYNISVANFKEPGVDGGWSKAWQEEQTKITGNLNSAKQDLAAAKLAKDKEGIADANIAIKAWTSVLGSLNAQQKKVVAYRTAAQKNQGAYLSVKEPTPAPTAAQSMRTALEAYRDIFPDLVPLEADYQKQLTEATGAATRAEFFKNIQSLEGTGEIAALREKVASADSIQARINSAKTDAEKARLTAMLPTDADRAKLAAFEAQTAQMTPFQRQAAIEAQYAAAGKQGELGLLRGNIGDYQSLIQGLMPGSQETIAALGQLGKTSAQEGQQGLQLADYLAPFRQQATTPGGAPAVDAQGNPILQQGGPLRQLDLTSALSAISPYEQGAYMQGIPGPELKSTLLNINQDLVNQYMGSMPGVAQGAAEMGRIANEKLRAGGNLTPAEMEAAASAAREAFAARGTALGPQSATTEVLARTELARQREAENLAMGQQLLGGVSALYQPAMAQTFQRQTGAEQYELGAQAQMFGQGMAQEELSRAAQAQQFQQGALLAGIKQQEFDTNLSAATQAQNMATQAAQARQGYAANAAQIASGVLGTQQGALTPIMSAYYNTPSGLGIVSGATAGATNAYQLGGLNVVNPLDPTATSLNVYPSQLSLQQQMGGMQMASAERVAAAQLAAAKAGASRSSGGGGLLGALTGGGLKGGLLGGGLNAF